MLLIPKEVFYLNLLINNGAVSTKIYNKQGEFHFDTVNVSFLDGDVPRPPSYGVFISQLIRFARASLQVNDFNNCNKFHYWQNSLARLSIS